MKILIVDDDEKIRSVIVAYVINENHTPIQAATGQEALEKFRSYDPDMIILDLMLPGLTGNEVCEEIRKTSNVSIIMLTALDSENNRIDGLDQGADDYITKPFSPRELMARIKAVQRRMSPKTRLLQVGPISADEDRFRATVHGDNISLTRTEFAILTMLMNHVGQVLSRKQLQSASPDDFGEGSESYERTIDSHIKNLRKKLGLAGTDAGYIETVYGVGYKMAEVNNE